MCGDFSYISVHRGFYQNLLKTFRYKLNKFINQAWKDGSLDFSGPIARLLPAASWLRFQAWNLGIVEPGSLVPRDYPTLV